MKVSGAGSAGGASGARAPRAASGGFAPAMAEESGGVAATARGGAMAAVNSVDALLALQETLGPPERRRRAVRRAGGILDALDEVKLDLLEGGDPGAALDRLRTAVRQARDETGDGALEDVLEQVEIRAAVEIAKREMAQLRGPALT